jgi:hypothetical protein
MDWAAIESVSVSLSLIVAAITLIIGVRGEAARRKRERIIMWQQSVIHSIFQRAALKWLTFNEIVQKYRSEASANIKDRIGSNELTEEALRSILVRMVSSRVIDQRGGDEYSLLTVHDPKMEAMPDRLLSVLGAVSSRFGAAQGALSDTMQEFFADEQALRDNLINTVAESSSMTQADLTSVLSQSTSFPASRIRAQIVSMISDGKLVLDEDGLVSIPGIQSS